jgi:malonyl-CoA O-methyltransferase
MSKRFNRASKTYDAHAHVQRTVAAEVARLARYYLPTHGWLVDAGCGTGALASLLPDYSFIQIDVSEAMCHAAASSHPQHPTVVADARHLPLHTGSMAGYLSSLCWQWVEPVEAAIAEMQRVLAPSGYGIVATLCDGTFAELSESLQSLSLPKRMLICQSAEALSALLSGSSATILTHRVQAIVQHYVDVSTFFAHLQGIGATASTIPVRPLTRSELSRLMAYYDTHFRDDDGIRVTYHVGYWVVQYE